MSLLEVLIISLARTDGDAFLFEVGGLAEEPLEYAAMSIASPLILTLKARDDGLRAHRHLVQDRCKHDRELPGRWIADLGDGYMRCQSGGCCTVEQPYALPALFSPGTVVH